MTSKHSNYRAFDLPNPETRANSLENPSVSLAEAVDSVFGSGRHSFAGETVNEATALGVPAIWSAVNVIAGTIASLPLHLYRDDGNSRVKADSDPLYRILHDVVNADYETSYAWRKKMVLRLIITGRALAFIERNKAGRVTGLWYLDPASVTVQRVDGRKVYRYRREDGREVVYQPFEVIDLVWMPSADGLGHIDPIQKNRNSIGLAIAAERYASIMFENGGVPPLQLTRQSGAAPMSPAASSRAAYSAEESIRQARREGRRVLFTDDLKLEGIGFDPSKQQMLELRKFQVTEIARIWNIPPVFLQDLTSGTFNNSEVQDILFAKHTLTPLLELIEQEFGAKLFSDRNRANSVEFVLEGLLRGDFATRMQGYQTAINGGFMTPNEVRAKENLPASDQENADSLFIQSATLPIDQVVPEVTAVEPVVTTDEPEDTLEEPSDE